MKIKSKVTIILLVILTINQGFAIEKSSIILEKNPLIQNTDKNIKQAKIIENEVNDFRKKLILIQKKYKLENDKTINNSIKDLGEIIYILRKIQTTKINKNTATNVIKIVINDLKNINFKTKSYLKNYLIKVNIYKNKYNKLTNKLNILLDKLVSSFIKNYQKKEKLTKKDKKIIKLIQDIYNNSVKLKNYRNKNFYSKKEIKDYLVKIIKQIKKDLREIKTISKKR